MQIKARKQLIVMLVMIGTGILQAGCCDRLPLLRPIPVEEAKAICEYRGYTHIKDQPACLVTDENCGDCNEITKEYCEDLKGGSASFEVRDGKNVCILKFE